MVELNERGELVREIGQDPLEGNSQRQPSAISADSEGRVWVAEYGPTRLSRFNQAGERTATLPLKSGGFAPSAIAAAPSGGVWVGRPTPTGAEIYYVNPAGEILHTTTSAGSTGPRLGEPTAMATDAAGDVFVAVSGGEVDVFDEEGRFLMEFEGRDRGTAGIAAVRQRPEYRWKRRSLDRRTWSSGDRNRQIQATIGHGTDGANPGRRGSGS